MGVNRNMSKTIFCDIDGTLVEHCGPNVAAMPKHKMKLLDGALEKLQEWDKRGYNIILTTGRKESLRKETERQLSEVGIFYDQLVMGIGGGDRVLINDKKSDGRNAAWAIRTPRNAGLKSITVDSLEEIGRKYFSLFENKDIEAISNLFSENITLKDWSVSASGKEDVVSKNIDIFNACKTLKINIINIYACDMTVVGQIEVVANGEIIPVIDIINFNNNGKIISIDAYRGN